jgi:hypothetical protein
MSNPVSMLGREVADEFSATCYTDVVLKQLDGEWVPWYFGRSSRATQFFEVPLDPGVHALLFSANFDRIGLRNSNPPASAGRELRMLDVKLEGGQRYFFCAVLRENRPPEEWEPAVYTVKGIQN